jgi:hypothetical protein
VSDFFFFFLFEQTLSGNLILSSDTNPFFFSGKFKGVGSPHTDVGSIWHLGLIVQAMTSNNLDEIKSVLDQIKVSDFVLGFDFKFQIEKKKKKKRLQLREPTLCTKVSAKMIRSRLQGLGLLGQTVCLAKW